MDLHSSVEDKVLEVYIKAQDHFKKKFELPSIEYSRKMRSVGGLAFTKENLIKLNERMMELNGQKFVDEVVPHEVLHIVEKVMFGSTKHHKRFYNLGKTLGYNLQRCHPFRAVRKLSKLVFVCKCREITNLTNIMANRIVEMEKYEIYKCQRCHTPLKLKR